MKKILFSAYSLDIGGIEKALVMLVNKLQEKYDVTLVLEEKKGIFLKDINPNIEILEYTPANDKNKVIRKLKNLGKRIKFIIKYRNKYDFSASFATYSNPGSFIARTASKNCYLWGHADYLTLFNNDYNQVKKFFNKLKYKKFKRIVFVANEAKRDFLKVFPEMVGKTTVCNNLINGKKIKEDSNKKVEYKESKEIIFLNVGRHEERQKKLTRLIDATEMLENEFDNFEVLLVGDGPDTEMYKKIVHEKKMENVIKFLGKKENPYPYYKLSDCIVLTSEYEGYPVVFLESYILNKPIITTKVSDYEEIKNKYGYVAEKNSKDIYVKMKMFIEEGFAVKEEFDYEKFNNKIMKNIENMIEEK